MTKVYEYGRIAKLAESLGKAGISQEIVEQVTEGGEAIGKASSREQVADWMREAMLRMGRLLDKETRIAVREACACCLGGKRLEMAKRIAREHEALEDRIAAANEAKLVFGHSVEMLGDGRVRVAFSPEGLAEYRCACLGKPRAPLPITYCYCCGGHVKHHLQTALGRPLACTVVSSALSSGGRKPCTFVFSTQTPCPNPTVFGSETMPRPAP